MFESYRHRWCFYFGTRFLRQGAWQKAESLFRHATEIKPDELWSHNNLAIALLKLERFEESCAVFRRAIQLNPNFPESHENLGAALTKLYRWEEAVAAYRSALLLDPARLTSHENLGNSLFRLGLMGEAAIAYKSAIKLDPASPVLFKRLGLALFRAGSWEEAAAAYRQSVALDPDDSEAYSGLATVLSRIEPSWEAREGHLQKLAESPDSAAIRLGLGVELLKLGRWEEAVSCLQSDRSLATENASFHFLMVNPLLRLGRFEEAVAAHRRAVEVGGTMPCLPGEPAASRFKRRQNALWTHDNLPPKVFRVERWLERLFSASTLSSSPTELERGRKGRLLFVLDNDYGELTTLMYLTLGQPLAREVTLLLPDRLIAKNADALPSQTHRYTSIDDLVRVVDAEKPEIVFICSAYLFSIHQIFSLEELDRLVGVLRDRKCRIVTTDPFLGMLSRQDPRTLISIDIPEKSSDLDMEKIRRIKKVEDEKLRTAFTHCERLFRNVSHLYPAFCDIPPLKARASDKRNLSFFNSELVCPELESGVEEPGNTGNRPHWLFLLSKTDYEVQMVFGGLRFVDIVAMKLIETVAAGRHPILIAPDELVDSVISRMPAVDGVDIISFCPFNRFMALLLSAEYAFYWNVVSHSILFRLFNTLPVILFDKGHLIRNAPAMYDRVIQWYYQGWEPEFRDHRTPLTLETVSAWSKGYRLEAEEILERFRRAPTPKQMIDRLISGDSPVPT